MRELGGGRAVVGAPEPVDVDLAHRHHGLHGAAGALAVGAAEEFGQRPGHDLPGQAVAVLEPAASPRRAAVAREGVPEPVDLRLVRAVDHEGDGLREAELRTAVEAHEAPASVNSTTSAAPLGVLGLSAGARMMLSMRESGSSET